MKQEYKKSDKNFIWHPFTQMQDWLEEEQLVIERGNGSYIFDIKGNKYLDGISSLWVNLHGHNNKKINQTIKKQLDKISHSTLLGLSNVPSIELAEKLIKITPENLKKVFYSDSGSTAIEIAIKMSFQYYQNQDPDTKKTKLLTLTNAYHGDTIGSVSVGGMELFHKIYKPLLFNAFKAPSPYCYRCPLGLEKNKCSLECLQKTEEILRLHHWEICGMTVEPLIQAAAGMITMPKGYLKGIETLCKKHGIFLITDEVATGFGRTGKMFACDHENIQPDIMTIAKGITGGYLPLAATLTSQEIYNGFLADHTEKKTFFHGHTYTGNPLGCAAALGSLDIFKKETVLDKLQNKIEFLSKELEKFYELEHVGDIRQCGFMVGIELVKDKKTKEEFTLEEKIGIKVIKEARKQGVILRPLGNVIVLMPPLSISIEELKILLNATYESIKIIN